MSIAEKKVKLEELKDERPLLEKKVSDANRGYKIGAISFLIGIPLIFLYGFGFLLIIAGGLAGFTQFGKRTKYTKELDQLNDQIKTLRREIAQIEAGEETAVGSSATE